MPNVYEEVRPGKLGPGAAVSPGFYTGIVSVFGTETGKCACIYHCRFTEYKFIFQLMLSFAIWLPHPAVKTFWR
jgi:hypothetical protein